MRVKPNDAAFHSSYLFCSIPSDPVRRQQARPEMGGIHHYPAPSGGEEMGWIERRPDAHDRRMMRVFLTKPG